MPILALMDQKTGDLRLVNVTVESTDRTDDLYGPLLRVTTAGGLPEFFPDSESAHSRIADVAREGYVIARSVFEHDDTPDGIDQHGNPLVRSDVAFARDSFALSSSMRCSSLCALVDLPTRRPMCLPFYRAQSERSSTTFSCPSFSRRASVRLSVSSSQKMRMMPPA